MWMGLCCRASILWKTEIAYISCFRYYSDSKFEIGQKIKTRFCLMSSGLWEKFKRSFKLEKWRNFGRVWWSLNWIKNNLEDAMIVCEGAPKMVSTLTKTLKESVSWSFSSVSTTDGSLKLSTEKIRTSVASDVSAYGAVAHHAGSLTKNKVILSIEGTCLVSSVISIHAP